MQRSHSPPAPSPNSKRQRVSFSALDATPTATAATTSEAALPHCALTPSVAASRDNTRHRATTLPASAAPASLLVAPHPHGVRPLGSAWLLANAALASDERTRSLGAFSVLPDALLSTALLSLLDARSLLALSAVSRYFYAFANATELWRALAVQCALRRTPPALLLPARAVTSWRHIVTGAPHHPLFALFSGEPVTCDADDVDDDDNRNNHTTRSRSASSHQRHPLALHAPRFFVYSDALYAPWQCAAASLPLAWLACEYNVERVDAATLSVADFVQRYELTNRPVIFTASLTRQWPATQQWRSREYMVRTSGADTLFEVGPVHMPLDHYFSLCDRDEPEERPLLLFDPRAFDKCPALAADYVVPAFFSGEQDLFAVLGERRPDHRWLIVGPRGSGSSFHIDPNATSAWNVSVRGRKKWLMFPPHCAPPGVLPSRDGAQVTAPVSIAEWMLSFYAEAARHSERVEFVAQPGELVFVPRGWWHMVLNLDETVAVTQNYCSPANLPHTLAFLRDRRDQVSGTRQKHQLHELFVDALRRERPHLLAAVEEQQRSSDERRRQQRELWRAPASGDSAFTFSFS